MKKIFTNLFLLATLFLASTNLTAQTYNNGTWYSLYDATEHYFGDLTGSSDDTFSVFAPTTGNLSFQWKKTGKFFGYPIFNLTISESSNGSNYTSKYTLKSGSDTKQDSYVTVTTAVSENITHLKFKQSGGTLKRYYKDIKLPLAKHILLNDGTSFGTTSVERTFTDSVTINETSEALTVELRSFLTAGDITITSDNPAFSVAKTKYSVGNNACASAKGTAGSEAGGGTLGNINNYDVLIYFHPKSAGAHSGTITLTDGTSTATIKVSGTCNKIVPEVTSWPKVAPITYGTPLTLDMLVGGTANVPGNFEFADLSTTLNAGTQNLVVRFIPEDQNIYATVENTIAVVVNKADQTIAWDFATTEMTVDEVLTLSATATAGEVTFTITGDAATLEGNTLTAVKAGKVTITASQAGNNNYNAAPAIQNTITVLKATPTITWPTLNDVVYGATYADALVLVGGEATIGDKAIKGAFSITNMPTDLAQVPAVGEYTFGIVFTPAKAESYNEVSDSVTLQVTKQLQTIAWDFADQELLIGNTLTLSATAPAGEVSFAIQPAEGVASLEGNTLTALAAGTVTITATAPENENYEAASVSYTVTVIKHTPEIITLPTVAPLGYGTALTDDMLNGGESNIEGTWSFVNPTQSLNMGNNEVAIRFTPTNTDLYNTIDATITIVVEKAETIIYWELESNILDLNDEIFLYAETANGDVITTFEITGPQGILQYDSEFMSLTAIGYGTTEVTAYYPETETHKAAELSYEITVFDPNSETTGITNTTITGKDTEKVFINGQLFIIRNNQWYDTTGKLVK